MTHRAVVLATALLLTPRAPSLAADEPPTHGFTGRALVTSVELTVDVRDAAGRVPTDLVPADFEVLEDGQPVALSSVERLDAVAAGTSAAASPAGEAERAATADPLASRWRLVIWFDEELASSRSIRLAAEQLAGQANRLTTLGAVEIVVAG